MEWIKCSELMPEDMADVLVTNGEEVKSMWWNGSRWVSCLSKYTIDSDDVTHWMPLPTPPTE